MAEITISLLTPISVRISWSGSGDFEVWWKSDHPAGQEYAPLVIVTGTSYDVGSLSWTTTYYFKVRQVGGTFGSAVQMFICCGQAVILGPPTTPPAETPPDIIPPPSARVVDLWQQSADPYGEDIVLSAYSNNREWQYIWLYKNSAWTYLGRVNYSENVDPNIPTWDSRTPNYPAAVRMIGDRIIVFGVINYNSSYGYGWYRIVRRMGPFDDFANGGTLDSWNTGVSPWIGYYTPDATYRSRIISERSIVNSCEFRADGRVVVGLLYIDYDDPDWKFYATLKVSNDYGSDFTENGVAEILIFASDCYNDEEPWGMSLAETSDGVIWISIAYTDGVGIDPYGYGPADWMPSYSMHQEGFDISAKYMIFKYDSGVVTYVGDIPTNLTNTWDAFGIQQSWDFATANCNLAAEGTKLVACYTHDFTQVNWDALGCDYGLWAKYNVHAAISGTGTIYIDISLNSGAYWVKKQVSFGETIYVHPEYMENIPAVCISSGNILVYCLVGNGTETDPGTVGRRIVRSTDNGDTWSVVYDFAGVDNFLLPWIMTMRSDGDSVVITGCLASLTQWDATPSPAMALWRSLDAGATWAAIEVVPTQISYPVVPA